MEASSTVITHKIGPIFFPARRYCRMAHCPLRNLFYRLWDRRWGKLQRGQRGVSVRTESEVIKIHSLCGASLLCALGLLSCSLTSSASAKFRSVHAWCLVAAEETRVRETERPEEGLYTTRAQRTVCSKM